MLAAGLTGIVDHPIEQDGRYSSPQQHTLPGIPYEEPLNRIASHGIPYVQERPLSLSHIPYIQRLKPYDGTLCRLGQ